MLGLIGPKNVRHFQVNGLINALICPDTEKCHSNTMVKPVTSPEGWRMCCCGSFSEVRGLMFVFVVLIHFSSTCTYLLLYVLLGAGGEQLSKVNNASHTLPQL